MNREYRAMANITHREDNLVASLDNLSKQICQLVKYSTSKNRKKVRCVKIRQWTKPQAFWQGLENICKTVWIPVRLNSRFKIKIVNITNPMVQTVNSEETFQIWLQVLKLFLLSTNRTKRTYSTIQIIEFLSQASLTVQQAIWITLKKDMYHNQLEYNSL